MTDAESGLGASARRRAFDAASVMLVPVDAAGSLLKRVSSFAYRSALRAIVRSAADEIDVNRVIARVDLEILLERLDLPRQTRRVLDEIDLAEIVRQSSVTVTSETVDAMRIQAMQADRALNKVVDRALRRRAHD